MKPTFTEAVIDPYTLDIIVEEGTTVTKWILKNIFEGLGIDVVNIDGNECHLLSVDK